MKILILCIALAAFLILPDIYDDFHGGGDDGLD